MRANLVFGVLIAFITQTVAGSVISAGVEQSAENCYLGISEGDNPESTCFALDEKWQKLIPVQKFIFYQCFHGNYDQQYFICATEVQMYASHKVRRLLPSNTDISEIEALLHKLAKEFTKCEFPVLRELGGTGFYFMDGGILPEWGKLMDHCLRVQKQ